MKEEFRRDLQIVFKFLYLASVKSCKHNSKSHLDLASKQSNHCKGVIAQSEYQFVRDTMKTETSSRLDRLTQLCYCHIWGFLRHFIVHV